MRGSLILLYNCVLTIFQALFCERKKLFFEYNLAITILVNISFLVLSYTFPILLIPFSFRPLISRLTSKIDLSNAVCKLSLFPTLRFVFTIPFINSFLSAFFLCLSFLALNVARPFLIP
jgi:hypothetical protein